VSIYQLPVIVESVNNIMMVWDAQEIQYHSNTVLIEIDEKLRFYPILNDTAEVVQYQLIRLQAIENCELSYKMKHQLHDRLSNYQLWFPETSVVPKRSQFHCLY